MDLIKLLIELAVELAVVIPLVIELVKYVKASIKEKNWGKLLDLIMKNITTAEQMFDSGEDKKEWVIKMIEESADLINYPFDEQMLSDLIDNIIEITKKVNK